MNKQVYVLLTLIIAMSFSLISAYADSNGIWVRAQDIVGGEDVVFGDDFSSEKQKFSFYSDKLVIGGPGENNGFISYSNSNDWSSGVSGDRFQIIRNESDRIRVTSGETLIRDEMSLVSNVGNAVINVDAPDYAGIDFGDTSNTLWGIGRTMDDDFYIDEDGVANRFMIKQGGNVGIGTNNPVSRLHVAGDLTVDSISSSTIDDIDSELSSLDTRIGNLEARMGSAENDISSLDTQVGNLDTRMDSAEGDISSLDTRMDTAESEISSLQSTVNNHGGRISDLESESEDILSESDVKAIVEEALNNCRLRFENHWLGWNSVSGNSDQQWGDMGRKTADFNSGWSGWLRSGIGNSHNYGYIMQFRIDC